MGVGVRGGFGGLQVGVFQALPKSFERPHVAILFALNPFDQLSDLPIMRILSFVTITGKQSRFMIGKHRNCVLFEFAPSHFFNSFHILDVSTDVKQNPATTGL